MKKLILLLICTLFYSFINQMVAQTSVPFEDIRTPFPKVLYQNNHPYIEVNQEWVKLVSIQDQAIEKIIQQTLNSCPRDWKTCFHKYWAFIMDELEIKRKDSIEITFIQNNQSKTQSFALKKENGELAEQFHYSMITKNKINRLRCTKTQKSFEYLTKRLDGYKKLDVKWLSHKEAMHDLEYLEWEIANNYSYTDLRGFDYQSALDAIALNLKEGISKRDFAYQLKMLMTNFGDGHSRVSINEVKKPEESKWLPFKIIKHENRFYAVDTKTKTFFRPDYPELLAINEIQIQHLFQLSKQLVTKANAKSMDYDAMNYLNITAFALKLAGEKNLKKATVTFGNNLEKQEESFSLSKHRMSRLIENHKLKDTILENNIGYIAINYKMEDEEEFIKGIHQAMQKIQNTTGLIIDIRGNPGGDRAPLIAFLSYFIKETKVTNIGKFRISTDQKLSPQFGYLERRYMFPYEIDEAYFNRENKQVNYSDFKSAVEKFKISFNPCKLINRDKFSDYHYMAVSPIDSKTGFYYDRPVIVLIDEGCFSAADIFAAGIRTGDQVRLLGNTTQGGSGYSKGKYLPKSRLKVKLSRMFSYQPDGNLYDTHGVIPDLQKEYTLEDRLGNTDSQLDEALQLLTKDL